MKRPDRPLGWKDARLLRELEKDSRAGLSRIARQSGMSKEVAHYRLARLMHIGLVRGFYPVVDYFALGYDSYRLLLNLSNFSETVLDRITKELKAVPDMSFTVFLQSDRDLGITLWATSADAFYEFYDNFVGRYSHYIQDKDFSLATKIYILRHDYLHRSRGMIALEKKPRARIQTMDEEDGKILGQLRINARTPTAEIAKRTGLSASTVSYRIRQMVKNGVVRGFQPSLDVSVLGYDTYKVYITLHDPGKKKLLAHMINMNPHATKITELIGKNDLEVKMDFKTVLELEGFLRRLRASAPFIKKFSAIPVAKDV